jgi:enoyl-CoA hydratase
MSLEQSDESREDPKSMVLSEVVAPHIVQLTLNRPHRRNAILVPEMRDALNAQLRQAEDDDDIKCIILTGAGSDFCSGDDVSRVPVEGFGLRKGEKLPQSKRVRGISSQGRNQLLYCDKTVIAAVRGSAYGLGFNLALSCDLIVASDDAKFARRQSRIGFAGMDMLLPVVLLKLGMNRGYEIIVTGRTVTAQELLDWGVASSVVSTDQLESEALRYAKAVAAHSTDGLMLGRQAKKFFWDSIGMAQWHTFLAVAHPLFTNLVWRDDESNLLKERERLGSGGEALKAIHARWEELGFE